MGNTEELRGEIEAEKERGPQGQAVFFLCLFIHFFSWGRLGVGERVAPLTTGFRAALPRIAGWGQVFGHIHKKSSSCPDSWINELIHHHRRSDLGDMSTLSESSQHKPRHTSYPPA